LKHSLFKKQSSDTDISVGKAAFSFTNNTCQPDLEKRFGSWYENSVKVQFHVIPLEL
jgi:hypothetical protein